MKKCPNCGENYSFFSFYSLKKGCYRKIKCSNCEKVFTQTEKTIMINTFLSVISILIVPQFKTLYEFIVIIALLVPLDLFICILNWPWNVYE